MRPIPWWPAWRAHLPGSALLFAIDGNHPVILRHRNAGGRVIFVRQGNVVVAEAPRGIPLVAGPRPVDAGGRIAFQVENTLAAAAAALSLEFRRRRSAAGWTRSPPTWTGPGRFNLLEINGATVIVDYGHNVPALTALVQAIGHFPSAGAHASTPRPATAAIATCFARARCWARHSIA